MKKISSVLTALFLVVFLAGCSYGNSARTESSTKETDISKESTASEPSESNSDSVEAEHAIRIGSLKGPTSIGLVSLMNSNSSANSYDFTVLTAADELIASMASGKFDIALVPANTASILYQKTNKGISVLDINTLGVLYFVSSDKSIKTIEDLKGKTVYLTGKGTTPDYVFHYLLKSNNLSDSDVTLEYKSEATEVAALLKEKSDAVGLLPQPFVTVACAQNDALQVVIDLTKEWERIQGESGSLLVTGVTVVRNDFLKEHPDEVRVFMTDHRVSTEFTQSNPDETADLIVQAGIIEKKPIAKKALPYCNITYIDGMEMKTALSGYLNVLFKQEPKSVGGSVPDDAFYYIDK